MARRKVRSRTRIPKVLARIILRDLAQGRIATLFGYEALFIAALRGRLCLSGWDWPMADQAARDLVAEALHVAKAKRPTWEQGQREWVALPGLLIERTRCANCHKRLPEGRPKYCSDLCQNAHHLRIMRLKEAHECQLVSSI